MATKEEARPLKKAVFIDRDGVINQDSSEYIKSWSEFKFLPGSIEAIKRLTTNGFTNIIITNQSAVNRKLISEKKLEQIFLKMKDSIKAGGGEITDIFYCPHTPEEECDCRKPKTGLMHQAQKTYRIDISSSCMVGDNPKDMECAKVAGCRYAVLVKSGIIKNAEEILADKNIFPDHVAADLLEAADWIINQYNPSPAL